MDGTLTVPHIDWKSLRARVERARGHPPSWSTSTSSPLDRGPPRRGHGPRDRAGRRPWPRSPNEGLAELFEGLDRSPLMTGPDHQQSPRGHGAGGGRLRAAIRRDALSGGRTAEAGPGPAEAGPRAARAWPPARRSSSATGATTAWPRRRRASPTCTWTTTATARTGTVLVVYSLPELLPALGVEAWLSRGGPGRRGAGLIPADAFEDNIVGQVVGLAVVDRAGNLPLVPHLPLPQAFTTQTLQAHRDHDGGHGRPSIRPDPELLHSPDQPPLRGIGACQDAGRLQLPLHVGVHQVNLHGFEPRAGCGSWPLPRFERIVPGAGPLGKILHLKAQPGGTSRRHGGVLENRSSHQLRLPGDGLRNLELVRRQARVQLRVPAVAGDQGVPAVRVNANPDFEGGQHTLGLPVLPVGGRAAGLHLGVQQAVRPCRSRPAADGRTSCR